MADRYIPATPANIERERVAQRLIGLAVFHKSQLDPVKYYARWAGGFIEVNDDLLMHCICPSDLLGVPCEWDELLEEGCSMVRLCQPICKYTEYQCPDKDRNAYNLEQPVTCGHVHWEVEKSCRFVATAWLDPHRICKQVLEKARYCSAGHDLAEARQHAENEHWIHLGDARAAGSVGRVKFGHTY